ncbi:MAG: hypothetical protein V4714_08265 [Bacteroidota bacterium]
MPNADFSFFLTYNETESEVAEPIGWDSVVFTLRRSEEYSGLTFEFSDSLQFDREGGALIKQAFDADGIDAVMAIRIETCDAEILYNGVINFAVYSEKNACPDECAEFVTVGIMQSGLTQKFKNRMETPVNLEKETGIDGGALTEIESFDLLLHSKEIVFIAEYKKNAFITDPYFEVRDFGLGASPDTEFYAMLPLGILVNDFGESALETIELDSFQPLFYSGLTYPGGITERTLHLAYSFDFRLDVLVTQTTTPLVPPFIPITDEANDAVIEIVLIIKSVTTSDIETETVLQTLASANYPYGDNTHVSLSGTTDVVLPPDCNFSIMIKVSAHYYGGALYTKHYQIGMTFDDTSTLDYYENSTLPPSSTKAYLLYEAFTRVAESITGSLGSFKSDFFGGLASIPDDYEADGCGRHIALTNGLNIRQLKTKAGGLFPISVSFKQLFDALNAIYSLGMRVEFEDGIEKIRVEPKAYFYNSDVSYVLKNVKDIEKTVALDLIYNEAEFGYSKWETQTKNGIDEFNAKHNYSLPIIQAKKKLSQICSFVTGGYAIETCRRLQFKTNPNSDSDYDNELFLISCNKAEVTTDKYSIPPISTVYDAGTISERDENFTSITGIISPETAYNLRFSPARMLCSWYPVLAASLVKKAAPVIKFQSASGNYELSDEQVDDCDVAGEGLLIEGQDITMEDVAERLRTPYYLPENFNFEFPISFKVFMQLKAKAINAIRFGCTDTVKGYIKEVTYQPNSDGGIASFKVVRAAED